MFLCTKFNKVSKDIFYFLRMTLWDSFWCFGSPQFLTCVTSPCCAMSLYYLLFADNTAPD